MAHEGTPTGLEPCKKKKKKIGKGPGSQQPGPTYFDSFATLL